MKSDIMYLSNTKQLTLKGARILSWYEAAFEYQESKMTFIEWIQEIQRQNRMKEIFGE